jgi:hypothetical protein
MKHFPIPYPEELYYGVIARAFIELGRPAPETFSKSIMGKKRSCGILIVKNFVVGLPEGHPLTEEKATREHSLAPLIGAFRTTLPRRSLPEPEGLNSCPICRGKMLATFGEAYWDRRHQMPNIEVCVKHGVPLETATRPCRRLVVGRLKTPDFFSPAETEWEEKSPMNPKLQQEVGSIMVRIMECENLAPGHRENLWNALTSKGWRKGKYIDSQRLLRALDDRYGPSLQSLFQIPLSQEGTILIREIISGGETTPTRVAMLYHFLKLDPSERVERPPEKEPAPPNKRYPRVRGAKEKTRMKHRKVFAQILEKNPSKSRGEINLINTTCSSWLRQHDREWWGQQLKGRSKKIRVNYNRVEYHDEKAAVAVRAAARKLAEKQGRPERVTKHRILEKLSPEDASRVRSALDQLPITAKVLREVCESFEQVWARRLTWAKKNLPENLRKGEFLAQAGLRTAWKKNLKSRPEGWKRGGWNDPSSEKASKGKSN